MFFLFRVTLAIWGFCASTWISGFLFFCYEERCGNFDGNCIDFVNCSTLIFTINSTNSWAWGGGQYIFPVFLKLFRYIKFSLRKSFASSIRSFPGHIEATVNNGVPTVSFSACYWYIERLVLFVSRFCILSFCLNS